jgi:hypothetical protein
MNYIKHLNTVFDIFYKDNRLSANHISLYMALFHSWNDNRFNNPFAIGRSDVMKAAKIGSVSTYTKCVWELHKWEYIQYNPSHNPATGTFIYLYRFDTTDRTTELTTDDTTGVQLEEHLPYSINYINKKENIIKSVNSILPTKNEIFEFFRIEMYPQVEAHKFFNYFESNGWKVGGKTPMKNWHAAARNWILNIKNFNSSKVENPKPGKLNTGNEKNYGEPL